MVQDQKGEDKCSRHGFLGLPVGGVIHILGEGESLSLPLFFAILILAENRQPELLLSEAINLIKNVFIYLINWLCPSQKAAEIRSSCPSKGLWQGGAGC